MPPTIRTMTAADLPLGMRLKRQAGWNQTQQDWQRFLALEPDGCFVAQVDGRPVGTTTTCVFPTAAAAQTPVKLSGGGGVGWIAMVLVDESARGQGVGSALLRHAIDYLDGKDVASIRLDATPMGRPLYEKLGFVFQFDLVRYGGPPAPPEVLPPPPEVLQGSVGASPVRVQRATRDDWDEVIALDQRITATAREKLLRHLFTSQPDALRIVRDGDALLGYITDRPGENAHMIGPSAALTATAGDALLLDAFRRHAGTKVYVDTPVANGPATELAELVGLTIERPLHRMTRGTPVSETLEHLWASSGPEMG